MKFLLSCCLFCFSIGCSQKPVQQPHLKPSSGPVWHENFNQLNAAAPRQNDMEEQAIRERITSRKLEEELHLAEMAHQVPLLQQIPPEDF